MLKWTKLTRRQIVLCWKIVKCTKTIKRFVLTSPLQSQTYICKQNCYYSSDERMHVMTSRTIWSRVKLKNIRKDIYISALPLSPCPSRDQIQTKKKTLAPSRKVHYLFIHEGYSSIVRLLMCPKSFYSTNECMSRPVEATFWKKSPVLRLHFPSGMNTTYV
jgi:hypothetical protein